MKTVLFATDAKGAMRTWEIEFRNGMLHISWGVIGGAKQHKIEHIQRNSSNRSLLEQGVLQYNSRTNKQKDKGYVEDIEQALAARTNALELPRPMLATPIEKVKNINYDNAYVQRKYDGNRCLVANSGGQIVAYTRNGKPITSIGHIMEDIQISEGTILDGELYAHGEKLQTIVSWIKKEQKDTKRLRYICYDTIADVSFAERVDLLHDFDLGGYTQVAPCYKSTSEGEALEHFNNFRSQGYEGAILRWGGAGYEDGKRSKSLVKIKAWHDAEFEVLDIEVSKDGWGILICKTPEGRWFRCTAPGTHQNKKHVANNPGKYIGRTVTIEYAYLTAYRIPFHPVAKVWRLL